MNISNLTIEHLFEIANIATDNALKRGINPREIETGGYGSRRKVSWINSEDKLSYFFEIDSKNIIGCVDSGWDWNSYVIKNNSEKEVISTIEPAKIIDYCDLHGIDVRNKTRK